MTQLDDTSLFSEKTAYQKSEMTPSIYVSVLLEIYFKQNNLNLPLALTQIQEYSKYYDWPV